jgi:hypothetical protein
MSCSLLVVFVRYAQRLAPNGVRHYGERRPIECGKPPFFAAAIRDEPVTGW